MHDALEALFDPTELQRLAQLPIAQRRFADGAALRKSILKVIEQLRPPANISARSSAWRTYNILDMRYLQGLTQSEVAAQTHMTTRNVRYEQQKAIRAVATLLFSTPPERNELPSPAFTQRSSFADVIEVLHGAMNVLDAVLAQQNMGVNIHFPEALPPICANPMHLRQLLICALGWLMADMHDCKLDIRINASGDHVLIHLQKPATSGYQAVEELDDVCRLADAMRANVEVHNSNALRIALPIQTSLRVLIIDDDPDAAELARRYLISSSDIKFEVASTTQPVEAIKIAHSFKPACILLDLMMSERDGWEVLSLLKTNPNTRAIPVIISSVLKEHRLSLALGASAVLHKPYSAAQLITTLRSVIEQSPEHPAT
ncbi:MAG: response regulator [Anaerolineae bacterium]|nr:response regulator [Candidatus Roseilinea sp.]MDW8449912.1 response regulator [Anaerolineae bacterium]